MKRNSILKIALCLICIYFGFMQLEKKTAVAYTEGAILSELRLFAYNRPVPIGWKVPEGQLLPILGNEELYYLLGTTYGGDGETTFGLPDLRGASPLPGVKYGIAYQEKFPSSPSPHQLGDIKLLPFADISIFKDYEEIADGRDIPSTKPIAKFYGNIFGGSNNTIKLPSLQQANPYTSMRYVITMDGNSKNEPYLGEIRLYPIGKEPEGWIKCDGSSLILIQNSSLFSLIGTTFGGNGFQNFNIPDLRETAPLPELAYYIAIEGVFPSWNFDEK